MMVRCITVAALVLAPAVTLPAGAAMAASGPDIVQGSRTGLSWSRADNGHDINWADAKAYCSRKRGGWRLPSVEELATLYAPDGGHRGAAQCGTARCSVSRQFHLTGPWFWSATPVAAAESIDYDEEAWGVLLVNGARTQALKDDGYGARALCVRGP